MEMYYDDLRILGTPMVPQVMLLVYYYPRAGYWADSSPFRQGRLFSFPAIFFRYHDDLRTLGNTNRIHRLRSCCSSTIIPWLAIGPTLLLLSGNLLPLLVHGLADRKFPAPLLQRLEARLEQEITLRT